ncbi:hypothetical protein K8I31_04175 [bacterium]|nr:hypothetical protein [bacterium]
MPNLEFEHFLDEQIEKKQTEFIDWNAKLPNWLEQIDLFFEKVESFLKPYMESNKIVLEYDKQMIEEEYIGEYEVRTAGISIGSIKLKLVPKGMNVIGAHGRIDLIGPNGIARFVLVEKDMNETRSDYSSDAIERVWKIVTEPPHVELFALDEDMFLKALMDVANG